MPRLALHSATIYGAFSPRNLAYGTNLWENRVLLGSQNEPEQAQDVLYRVLRLRPLGLYSETLEAHTGDRGALFSGFVYILYLITDIHTIFSIYLLFYFSL